MIHALCYGNKIIIWLSMLWFMFIPVDIRARL